MNRILLLCLFVIFSACKNEKQAEKENRVQPEIEYTSVVIEPILENDSLSIRAIEIIGNNLAFAANNATFGMYNFNNKSWRTNTQKYDTLVPEFRAVASTDNDFFMLSVGSPALLYKPEILERWNWFIKRSTKKLFMMPWLFGIMRKELQWVIQQIIVFQ